MLQSCDNPDVGWSSRGTTRRSLSTETITVRMTTKEDGKEGARETGKNPFPVSRVQKILKADTVKHLTEENKRKWLTTWTATPDGLERGRVSHLGRHRKVHRAIDSGWSARRRKAVTGHHTGEGYL